MTREYRDILPGEMSVKTVLAEKQTTNDYGRVSTWVLRHHTSGFECAGSCARPTSEKWSITSFDGNATFGNSFLAENEARKVFESDRPWFAPKVEVS